MVDRLNIFQMSIFILWNEDFAFPFGIIQINCDDLVLWCIFVGVDVQLRTVIGNSVSIESGVRTSMYQDVGGTNMPYSASNASTNLSHFILGPISFVSRSVTQSKFFYRWRKAVSQKKKYCVEIMQKSDPIGILRNIQHQILTIDLRNTNTPHPIWVFVISDDHDIFR